MPDYDAGETQNLRLCVLVNGQNVDFDQAWEVRVMRRGRCSIICKPIYRRGAPRLADAKTLDIRLPMLQNGEQVAFSIGSCSGGHDSPRERGQERAGGQAAQVLQSIFSPIGGYIELLLEESGQGSFFGKFTQPLRGVWRGQAEERRGRIRKASSVLTRRARTLASPSAACGGMAGENDALD